MQLRPRWSALIGSSLCTTAAASNVTSGRSVLFAVVPSRLHFCVAPAQGTVP